MIDTETVGAGNKIFEAQTHYFLYEENEAENN